MRRFPCLPGHFGWNHPSLFLDVVLDYPTPDQGKPITEVLDIGGPNLRGSVRTSKLGESKSDPQ
jgi:hypothetical protein